MWTSTRRGRLSTCVLLFVCASCSEPADAGHPGPTITDDAGRRVALEPGARTVVSMVPSLTDLIVAMGAGERLAARTTEDDAPGLRRLPSVGRPATPSVERILELRPDLVVLWADEGDPASAVRRLDDAGIRVYTARVMTFAHLRRHLRVLGRLLERDAVADSLARHLARELAAAGRDVPEEDRPSVAYLIWPMPPSVAGPGTFIDGIIRRAGGRNAFGDLPVRWPTVSPETLVERDPDVVVVPRRHDPGARDAGIWAESPLVFLTAVRTGDVLPVAPDLFERPGLGSVEAVRLLAEFLHGPLGPDEGGSR